MDSGGWGYREDSLYTDSVTKSLKVTMNKLCVRLFIIIFIDVYCKSEYIPTVTNSASILANYFYFLRKITALRPSILNFLRSAHRVFPKKNSEQTVKKRLCWSRFTKNGTQNFMQRPHFKHCLKIAIDSTQIHILVLGDQ